MRVPLRIATALVAVFALSSGVVAQSGGRIPTVVRAEQAAELMDRLVEKARKKMENRAEHTIAGARRIIGRPEHTSKVFRRYSMASFHLQRTNFQAQRKIQQLEAKARRLMEKMEPNPEAEAMLSDAYGDALQNLAVAFNASSTRLQQGLLNPGGNDSEVDEPNGLRPTDDDGDDIDDEL